MKALSVLVAEDDPTLRDLYGDYLKRLRGFRLQDQVSSGPALFEALKEKAIHLVLLDLFLPGFDALDGLRRARVSHPRIDFIVLSVGTSPDAVRGSLCLGAFDYLIKPFAFSRFKTALEAYRTYHLGLTERREPWRQEELDRLTGTLATLPLAPDLAPPKGLQAKLVGDVTALLQAWDKSLSAAEVGELLGISRSTARRYLEYLVEIDQVSVDYAFREVGRPVKLYRLGGRDGTC